MNWEALTAISSAITAFVIAATVIVGYRQLEHLRRATQLEGTLRIFDDLNKPEIRSARRFVVGDLAQKLQDPHFKAELGAVGLADEAVHQELYILRIFEKIGTYVRHRLIDGDVVYDFAGPWIVDTWETLSELGVIAEHRRVTGTNSVWENFEYLYLGVNAWSSSKGSAFSGWRSQTRALEKIREQTESAR